MAKLYFKYGAMGSSKTAQALITKYNYEENDLKVWLIKPSADMRDGETILRSRIGLEASVEIVAPSEDVYACFRDRQLGHCDVIIVDECQFLEPEQVDQLRAIVDDYNLPVMCFGLRTDFQCHLFAGSRRLMEVADSILEIKNHLRLWSQGYGQRPHRRGGPHCYPGPAAAAGGQRQLHCHVSQMLDSRHSGAPENQAAWQRRIH